MDLLRDLPCRNKIHFSHYNQDRYKYVEAKKCISLKVKRSDHVDDCPTPQVIVMDKQSVLRCEMERRQFNQKKKAIKRTSDDSNSSSSKKLKLRKRDCDDSASDHRESD